MKIIYLHQYFNTPSMSGGTRSYYMSKRLMQLGHQVQMITSWRKSEGDVQRGWVKTNEDGIDVNWVSIRYSNHFSFLGRILAFFKFAWSSYFKAVSLEADVVFATSTPLTIAIPAVLVAKKKKIPLVFEVRDLWPELPISMGALKNPILKFISQWLERWVYKHSTSIIALSPGMKEGVMRQGFPQNKIAVIPNMSNIDEFNSDHHQINLFRSSRPWLQDRPLVLYVGTFGLINGLSYLIQLSNEINAIDPEVRILLIGDGKEFELLRELGRELSVLNKNLFIEKSIAKNLVPAALGAADISFSSFVENKMMWANSANKFFDSIASGTPLVLNYGGWQKDLLEENGCGFSMVGMSIHEAAQVLTSHIRDDDWKRCASKASLALAKRYFCSEKLTSEFEQVIRDAVEFSGSNAQSISPGKYGLKVSA